MKNAKSLNWATEMLYFTNKLNANEQKTPSYRHKYMKSSFQK